MSRDLLFEIGVEEMPAQYVSAENMSRGAAHELRTELGKSLAATRLRGGPRDPITFATPRRLAVMLHDVPEREEDFDEVIQGPSVKAAYDAAGQPTRALLGFCQGKGVDPADVRRVQTPKGEYVEVSVHRRGRTASEVFAELLASVATKLTFPKAMRWRDDDTRFARPVRWMVALLDSEVVPVQAFGLTAGRSSFGHRFLAPAAFEIAHATDYAGALKARGVDAEPLAREREIRAQLETAAGAVGGRVVADDELVEINNFLVERPTAFLGSFDAHYLDLPREVIVMALREHQRFFAVETADGRLLPHFIALRNGDDRNLDVIRKGNEGVLVARLEDAKFYWETDLKHAPASRVDALASVVWMEGLGSLRDKATRLEALVDFLAPLLAPGAAATAKRAALLAKTDLLSEMIGSGKEYAALEGVMGGHYARRAGETEPVAAAISEHYLPRGRSDALPATDAGALLAIADKLDHVAGAFVAGNVPSGSEDPFAVRRAANGALRILIEQGRHLDLQRATMQATAPFFAADPELAQAQIMKQLGEFWSDRVKTALLSEHDEANHPAYDAVDAAMSARPNGRPGWADSTDCRERARALQSFRGDPRCVPLVILFKRVANILAKATETLPAALDRARLTEPAEQALLAALEQARAATGASWTERRYERILPALLALEAPIHSFFDGVMVNVEDAAIRLNRLKLLAEVRELCVRGWDLSKIVVEGEKG